jgi:hypothetical protein
MYVLYSYVIDFYVVCVECGYFATNFTRALLLHVIIVIFGKIKSHSCFISYALTKFRPKVGPGVLYM